MKHYFLIGLAALAVLCAVVVSAGRARTQAKKPKFKNTQWVYVGHTFVADVGMSTDTYTLVFTSDRDCLWKVEWSTPSHPAMYMNSDGTVDTIPGKSSEHVSPATWKYSRNMLTLTFEDGSTRTFHYRDGHLIGTSATGEEITLAPLESEK